MSIDLTEAIKAATKVLVGPTSHLLTPADVEAAIEAAVPWIEKAVRGRVAKAIEASIVVGEERYSNCTCRAGKECHPHACHRVMNGVTARADEDTWPVHIATGVWDQLDPLIRSHAASIARGGAVANV